LPPEGSSGEIFITLRGMIFGGICKGNFGSVAYKACNATWNFVTNSPFAAGLMKAA